MSTTVTVDFGGWIQKAFDLYKANFVTLLLSGLIASLLSGLTFGVLAGPMYVGLFMVTLGLLDRKTPAPQPGDVFKGFSLFLPSFLLVLIVGAVSFVSSIVLPFIGSLVGLVLMTFVMFCLPMLADGQSNNIGQLLTRSFEMVKSNFWPLLALTLVAGIIAGVGAILCGIGVIVTMPMYPCIMSVAYRAYVPAGTSATPPPPVTPA